MQFASLSGIPQCASPLLPQRRCRCKLWGVPVGKKTGLTLSLPPPPRQRLGIRAALRQGRRPQVAAAMAPPTVLPPTLPHHERYPAEPSPPTTYPQAPRTSPEPTTTRWCSGQPTAAHPIPSAAASPPSPPRLSLPLRHARSASRPTTIRPSARRQPAAHPPAHSLVRCGEGAWHRPAANSDGGEAPPRSSGPPRPPATAPRRRRPTPPPPPPLPSPPPQRPLWSQAHRRCPAPTALPPPPPNLREQPPHPHRQRPQPPSVRLRPDRRCRHHQSCLNGGTS